MPTPLAMLIADADQAYRAGNAVMTDAEFDALVADLRRSEPDHPLLRRPGGGSKLLSLGNQDLGDWLDATGTTGPWTVTPKIDGCALALRYERGALVAAWTRSGADAMHLAPLVAAIPVQVPLEGALTVRGELWGHDGRQSTPAAALRRKVPCGDGLGFVAFEVIGSDEAHGSQLQMLEAAGFDTAPHVLSSSAPQLHELRAAWRVGELWGRPWPTDGIVVTVDCPAERARLGVTSVAPRYALAMKR
jgi:DNA ligase (NAD+)